MPCFKLVGIRENRASLRGEKRVDKGLKQGKGRMNEVVILTIKTSSFPKPNSHAQRQNSNIPNVE